jgi:hypothetical protein
MRNGNKTDNGVHEVGTEETRLAYQHDTPGQQVEEYLSQIALQNEEKQESARKHFSQVFDNPLKGFPHNEEFEVKEILEKAYDENDVKKVQQLEKKLQGMLKEVEKTMKGSGLSAPAFNNVRSGIVKGLESIEKFYKIANTSSEETISEKIEYAEYKFKNKRDAQKGLDYFKSQQLIKLDINDDGLSQGELAIDAGNKDMTKQHKEVLKMLKPKVLTTEIKEEEMSEGAMSDLFLDIQQGMTAKDIAKNYPVSLQQAKEFLKDYYSQKKKPLKMGEVTEGKKIQDIVRKHKRELQKAQKSGNLDLSKKAEDELSNWASSSGEIRGDDEDEFIDWLDSNLDDLVKGKIKESTISENYRVLAKHGMGAETKNSIKVGTEVDYYQKDGAKYMGKITKMTPKGYIVRDDKTKKDHEFTYHDRNAAKKLLKMSEEAHPCQGLSEDDPCWKDYKQVGMKKKNGKEVPNCVPKEDVEEGAMDGQKMTGQEISTYFRKNPVRDKDLKKAVEIALDHSGAMTYAINKIEKLKKGLSKKTEVKKALQYANEEVKYKLNVGVVFTEDKKVDLPEMVNINKLRELPDTVQKQIMSAKKEYDTAWSGVFVPMGDEGTSQRKFYEKQGQKFKDASKRYKALLTKHKVMAEEYNNMENIMTEESMGDKIGKLFKTKDKKEIDGIANLMNMTDVKVLQSMQKQNPKGFKKMTAKMGELPAMEEVKPDEPLKGKYPFQKKFSVESTFREMFETDLQEEMITYRVKGMQKPEEDKFNRSAKMMGLKITMDKGSKDTVIVMSGTKKKLRDFDAVARGKSSYGDPSTITHFDEK